MKLEKELYLGDGLYVSFNGYQLRLRTPSDHGTGDHVVYLDPTVVRSLVDYAKLAGLTERAG